MLSFNLKNKYYKMYQEGTKDTEYRLASDFWHSRLKNIKIGDTVKLVRAYTSEHLLATLVKIDLVTHSQLPSYVMRLLYRKDMPYYAIKLEITSLNL